MSHNLEYLLTQPGGLKIATIIFGLAAAILNSHSYAESPYTDFYQEKIRNSSTRAPGTELEVANMAMTFVFLGISIVYLLAHALFYLICESRLNKFVDVAFHLCGALFLFAGGTTLIYSAVYIEQSGCSVFQLVSAGPTPKHHFRPLPSFLVSSLHNMFTPTTSLSSTASSSMTQDTNKICHYFAEKIVGGSLNLLNGVLYGFLALIIYSTKLDDMYS